MASPTYSALFYYLTGVFPLHPAPMALSTSFTLWVNHPIFSTCSLSMMRSVPELQWGLDLIHESGVLIDSGSHLFPQLYVSMKHSIRVKTIAWYFQRQASSFTGRRIRYYNYSRHCNYLLQSQSAVPVYSNPIPMTSNLFTLLTYSTAC